MTEVNTNDTENLAVLDQDNLNQCISHDNELLKAKNEFILYLQCLGNQIQYYTNLRDDIYKTILQICEVDEDNLTCDGTELLVPYKNNMITKKFSTNSMNFIFSVFENCRHECGKRVQGYETKIKYCLRRIKFLRID